AGVLIGVMVPIGFILESGIWTPERIWLSCPGVSRAEARRIGWLFAEPARDAVGCAGEESEADGALALEGSGESGRLITIVGVGTVAVGGAGLEAGDGFAAALLAAAPADAGTAGTAGPMCKKSAAIANTMNKVLPCTYGQLSARPVPMAR